MIISGEIVYEPEEEDFPDNDWYCVIIGREVEGGCQVEICEGLDNCPYYKPAVEFDEGD